MSQQPSLPARCLPDLAQPAGRLVHRPGMAAAPFSRTRRLAAVLAVFICSGVMHELLFW